MRPRKEDARDEAYTRTDEAAREGIQFDVQRLPGRGHSHRRAGDCSSAAPPADLLDLRESGGGESFHIVNDHDPKPLFHKFSAEYPGIFEWVYEERGPDVWKVRIDRLVP